MATVNANSTRYSHRESKLDRTLFFYRGSRRFIGLSPRGGALGENAPRCPPLIGQGPPAHLSGAGPLPLPGDTSYSSTWLRSRRVPVSAPRRSSYKSYNIRGSRELEPRDPLSASQGTSSQRVVMARDGPKGSCRWDGLLDVII